MQTLPISSARPLEEPIARVLLFITPVLWTVNYLVARWAPGVIAPHALALGRWMVAATLLTLVSHSELWARRQHIRSEAGRFLLLGALGMWICGAFVYIGARSTTAVNIGLLYATSPVLIAAASTLWLRERLGWAQAAGVALALTGMLHILLRGHWQALGEVRLNPGDLWIAVAVVSWSVYSVLLRAWRSAFSELARLALIAWGGVLVLAPFTAWEALAWLPTELSWRSAGLVLAAALIPGAGAYAAYSFMQRVLGAARVSLVLYLSPLYSAVVGWLVLGERIQPFHGIGALLILPGIWLATRR